MKCCQQTAVREAGHSMGRKWDGRGGTVTSQSGEHRAAILPKNYTAKELYCQRAILSKSYSAKEHPTTYEVKTRCVHE